MRIEELDATALAAEPPQEHGLIFLPFVRLKQTYAVAGVEFVPLRDGNGNLPPVLQSAASAVDQILSGYVDRHGERFRNCVVATIPSKGWDLKEDDFGTVEWAASLLFLASWARNEYFPRFGGTYVNSSNFRPVGQRFTGDVPTYISISARRRDGHVSDGGYKHGKFTFALPVQCSIRENADVDEAFLKALDNANTSGAATIGRLRTAMPFIQLANTDDDFVIGLAEAILMGSAFEQLVRADGSAYRLAQKFGQLFTQFGSVTVEEAQKTRQDISLDASPNDHAVWRAWKYLRRWIPQTVSTQKIDAFLAAYVKAAHLKWWVHRKWIEELYDLRSKVVHKGTHGSRKWGWTLFEHLVMAAHGLPLAVKLLLVENRFYQLSDEDRIRCLAVDRLLHSTRWVDRRDVAEESPDTWTAIRSKIRQDLNWERAWEAVRKKHPDMFDGEDAPSGGFS
ncbi:MAG: hypothetical protein A3J29_23080 [Acidobacteria bacterium RIFCSPLOWO2_12_FULL_67_14b]|nr:MAG: hypothetical protein A3I61_13515 [Acidobacteria bacterium RIFCSPLOWO2_02_FULL_68_18]OFW45393.1 MAG: hypothetical protein A3J29_23080 [Acidobacteria bacterium RIFCSPLOWO2_12_FULL_67_14b]